jgi:hypothetical protein
LTTPLDAPPHVCLRADALFSVPSTDRESGVSFTRASAVVNHSPRKSIRSATSTRDVFQQSVSNMFRTSRNCRAEFIACDWPPMEGMRVDCCAGLVEGEDYLAVTWYSAGAQRSSCRAVAVTPGEPGGPLRRDKGFSRHRYLPVHELVVGFVIKSVFTSHSFSVRRCRSRPPTSVDARSSERQP